MSDDLKNALREWWEYDHGRLIENSLARIEELEAKLAKAVEDSEKYKHAFAAQSRKLQAVLHIEGVKATLAELKGQDNE